MYSGKLEEIETMAITVEIPSEIESQIFNSASRGDKKAIQNLLLNALAPTVNFVINQASENLTDDRFENLSKQLVEKFAEYVGSEHKPLSGYAASRDGIYEDHL